jgi:AraC-like DNA-binding protein
MRTTRRPPDRNARAGTLSYSGSPLLPGVHVLRLENFLRKFYTYIDAYYIVHVTRSSARLRYRRRDYEGGWPMVSLWEPGELVETDPRDTPESVRCLIIGSDALEAVAEELGHPSGAVHWNCVITDRPDFNRALGLLYRAMDSKASALEVQSRYLAALRCILGRAAVAAAVERPSGREDAAMRRACRTMEERLSENLTLDDLAAQAGLPRMRFFRAFQRATGVPPHEYQIQRRIAAARTRLARQERVIDVAFDLGFADQAHFTRHFRRIVGVPPKAFARALAPTWSVPR